MRRISCFLLALLMMLILAGCGESAPPADGQPLGALKENIYTDFLTGFSCYLGDDWEVTGTEGLEQALDKEPVVRAMYAVNEEEMYFLEVQYINFRTYENKNTLSAASEEEFLDLFLTLDGAAQEEGEALPLEKVRVNFLKQEHWAGKRQTSIDGIPCYKTVVWLLPEGLYGVGVTCTSLQEDRGQELLDLFNPLDMKN